MHFERGYRNIVKGVGILKDLFVRNLLVFIFIIGFLYPDYASCAENITQAHLGETAYLTPRGKWMIGLRQLNYGLFDRFSVETIPLYSLLGSWNVFGKVKLIDANTWAVAARAGMFYVTWEPIPEVRDSSLWRYMLSSILSLQLSPIMQIHFNVSNTGLYGDIISRKVGIDIKRRLINLESDIEYRVTDKRRILVGTGYDFSSEKFTLGGSHLWYWTTLYLKLGLTFRTNMRQGLSLLPYFDIGIQI